MNTQIICMLALALISFSLIGCQSAGHTSTANGAASTAQDDLLPADTTSVVLQVSGLSCPLCATNLEKELTSLPSVNGVDIDLETGRVTVGLSGGLLPTRSTLRRVVVGSGFTLNEIILPSEGA